MDKENNDKLEAFRQKMQAMKEAAGTTTQTVDIAESKTETITLAEAEAVEASLCNVHVDDAERSHDQLRDLIRGALKKKINPNPSRDNGWGPWPRDVYDSYVIYEWDDKLYKASYAILDNDGATVVTFGDPVEVIISYQVVGEGSTLAESGVLLEEADTDSSIRTIKVIQPGWNKGNVRFYPKEVLERDAGVFHAGLLMFKNHQTDQEAATRPEGSLDDLSAVFVENAKFDANGPDGEGVYAKVKVFSGFKETLDEIAPYIGVSIRASGTGFQGEADGHKGMVIESLDVARSVDFVTLPGAGGKVVQMFESATPAPTTPETVVVPKATEAKKEESMDVRETEEFKALEAERDKERSEKEKLQEAQVLTEAKSHVEKAIGKSELPDITKARLVKETSANPPHKDGKLDTEALDTKVTEALKEAAAEIAALTGAGEIKDNGDTADVTEAEAKVQTDKLKESGTNLFGLTEKGAEIFAQGRG